LPARRGRRIRGRDVAHIRLELERVGDLGVAREHLRDPEHFHDAALAHAEPPHLGQVEGGAEGRARGQRHREGQGLLQPP